MRHMTIGEFGKATRLSARALRLYDELGLVLPVRVDRESGYRLYSASQIEPARLVAQLRRVGMPLAVIKEVTVLDGPAAASPWRRWDGH